MKKFLSKKFDQETKNKLHKLEARWACFVNGNPAQKIKTIGVTGTKGKTTICHMIASILDEAGIKNAMETTINTKIDKKVTPHTVKDRWVTTPPAKYTQQFLKNAVKADCEYAILEVTSQAIDQNRIFGIDFDTLVYSNLSHEHLEYHETKENYFKAKLKLFQDNPQAKFIINSDDKYAPRFFQLKNKELFPYSLSKPLMNGVVARKMIAQSHQTIFTAAYKQGQITITIKMPGTFNVSNSLAAFNTAQALEINPEIIKKGLEKIKGVTGRMESFRASNKQNFSVIVDYAHNPDSLKNVYQTIRLSLERNEGRIIAVLGATGRRDKSKRPLMGALAGRYADLVVFTNEDPYDEDPMEIIEQIAAGIHRGTKKKHQWRLNRNYWKVLDRAQAIHKAIKEAKKNDVVIITGKGAEEVMAVDVDKFVSFSDRTCVQEELSHLFK